MGEMRGDVEVERRALECGCGHRESLERKRTAAHGGTGKQLETHGLMALAQWVNCSRNSCSCPANVSLSRCYRVQVRMEWKKVCRRREDAPGGRRGRRRRSGRRRCAPRRRRARARARRGARTARRPRPTRAPAPTPSCSRTLRTRVPFAITPTHRHRHRLNDTIHRKGARRREDMLQHEVRLGSYMQIRLRGTHAASAFERAQRHTHTL